MVESAVGILDRPPDWLRILRGYRYYWGGTKLYDFLAGSENIESSYFLTKSKALDAFPMLKQDTLVGALVYYGSSSAVIF